MTKLPQPYGYIATSPIWMNTIQDSIRMEDPPPAVPPTQTGPTPAERAMQARIDTLTAEKHELTGRQSAQQTQLAAAEAELARLRAAPPAAVVPPVVPPVVPSAGRTPAEIEAEIKRRAEAGAQDLAAQKAFDDGCEAILAAGEAQYGSEKYSDTMANFKKLGGGGLPVEVIQAVMELDMESAHHVLYELGSDLAQANKIVALAKRPVRLVAELQKLGKKAEVAGETNVPEPIPGVAGRGGVKGAAAPDDTNRADSMNTKDWMAAREKQLAERKRA